MSLVEEINKIEEELAEDRAKIRSDREKVDRELEGIAQRQAVLTGLENGINDKYAAIEARERDIQKREDKLTDIADLDTKRVLLARRQRELVEYENELARMKSRQDEREQKLTTERAELEEEKKTYKETLKTQFIKQLERVVQ